MPEPQEAAAGTPRASALVLVDALNAAYWCGAPPTLRIPMALMTQLLAGGRTVQLCFDASARHQLGAEAGVYDRLAQFQQHLVDVPTGRSADRVLLRLARSSGACIVSRDRFRDHRRSYRKLIDDPSRLLAGFVAGDRVHVPALALDAPLPSSIGEAWAQLEPRLSPSPA